MMVEGRKAVGLGKEEKKLKGKDGERLAFGSICM